MVGKVGIVRALGAERLLLPAALEDALVANEQIKYAFALLQQARDFADAPASTAADLRSERLAAHLTDPGLDTVVAGSRPIGPGRYAIPRARDILATIDRAMGRMLQPLEGTEADELAARRRALPLPEVAEDDGLEGAAIDRLTAADRAAGDSLHLLVMDAHKALNRLQAEIATETVAGARAYGLREGDRPRIAAFMAGVARTAPLKFEHPGLATTATAWGERLVIQNDIGTTDAHVLVVTIEGLGARVTYTDIHAERIAFFRRLFAGFDVQWSGAEQRHARGLETGGYTLVVGTFVAGDEAGLLRFLDHLGSRLVFLIDWNRARKQLRAFVGKAEAIGLLDWAAAGDVGHRGLLAIGGDKALWQAMEFAAPGRLHLGDRLIDVLGGERAVAYLRLVLETAARGLLAGRSPARIRDEIKVELRASFETGHQRLLAIAARHAACLQQIGAAVHGQLLQGAVGLEEASALRDAERCARWESEADRLLNEARAEVRRMHGSASAVEVLERADDAADALEEAAFLATLVARHGSLTAVRTAAALGQLLDEDARAFVSCLECARHLKPAAAAREDVDDFLAAVERMFEIEHLADAELRRATASAVAEAEGHRDLYLSMRLADVLESASDALAHAAQLLRRYVLEEVMQP